MLIKIINPNNKPKKYKRMVGLLLAWNYKDAIIKNEKEFLKKGVRFLIPIPKPKICFATVTELSRSAFSLIPKIS